MSDAKEGYSESHLAHHPAITGIAFEETGDRICISTRGAGVFCSLLNGSYQWTRLNEGLPNLTLSDLTIDPHNPSILYVSAREPGQSYRTTDGGLHWEEANDGLQVGRLGGWLAPDPQTPGRLLLTGLYPPMVCQLYESKNHGASWTKLATLPSYTFTKPVIDTQSGWNYVVTLDGLYRTQDPAGRSC